jgi:hypothetical protein
MAIFLIKITHEWPSLSESVRQANDSLSIGFLAVFKEKSPSLESKKFVLKADKIRSQQWILPRWDLRTYSREADARNSPERPLNS